MNTFTIDTFERPRLRDHVTVEVSGRSAILEYRQQGCTLEFPEGTEQEATSLVTALKQGGRTDAELRAAHPVLGEELAVMLRELDALGLLTESGTPRVPDAIKGRQFYNDLYRMADRAKRRYFKSRYYEALLSGEVTRAQLIGYALEYYHLVAMAPTLLAPALAYADSPRSKTLLLDFYESELRHDRFLIGALGAVGVSADTLAETVPLPATFALCSSLGAYARQHLLSFKAALFLFEEPYDEFNDAFRARCQALEMPPRFYEPIIRHAALNEDAEHDAISERLVSDVEAVSTEEQQVVKKHIAIMIETLARQEEQILRYYGDPSNPCPRLFA